MNDKFFVVSYILGGHGVATRHVEGCGTLRVARKQATGEMPCGVAITKLEVWDDEEEAK